MAEANYISVRDGTARVSYTLLSEAGVAADPHGAAQHTDVTREVFLPAVSGYVQSGTPGTDGANPYVSGAANSIEPEVYHLMKVPADFVSFTKVEAVWYSAPASGNMYWELYSRWAADGEARATHTDAPGVGVTATAGSYLTNIQEPANPLTLTNLALGDILMLKFKRTGSNALDTLDSVAYYLGLIFTYTANQ